MLLAESFAWHGWLSAEIRNKQSKPCKNVFMVYRVKIIKRGAATVREEEVYLLLLKNALIAKHFSLLYGYLVFFVSIIVELL